MPVTAISDVRHGRSCETQATLRSIEFQRSLRKLGPRFGGPDWEGRRMKGRVMNSSIMAGLMGSVVVVLVMLASVPKTSAIPAFSRKYQTSCTTCHNNYPELNDFGEAFKKNGFKFPKDDETFVKEPPVLLGAKAQREAFPQAVYPGEIPGFLPIAFRYSGNFNWNKKQPPDVIALNGFTPRTDLFV